MIIYLKKTAVSMEDNMNSLKRVVVLAIITMILPVRGAFAKTDVLAGGWWNADLEELYEAKKQINNAIVSLGGDPLYGEESYMQDGTENQDLIPGDDSSSSKVNISAIPSGMTSTPEPSPEPPENLIITNGNMQVYNVPLLTDIGSFSIYGVTYPNSAVNATVTYEKSGKESIVAQTMSNEKGEFAMDIVLTDVGTVLKVYSGTAYAKYNIKGEEPMVQPEAIAFSKDPGAAITETGESAIRASSIKGFSYSAVVNNYSQYDGEYGENSGKDGWMIKAREVDLRDTLSQQVRKVLNRIEKVNRSGEKE